MIPTFRQPIDRSDFIPGPARVLLDGFGAVVFETFGEFPFLVGSALSRRDWRDVDVRLILSDDDYATLLGMVTEPHCLNSKWNGLCLAFSALGERMTGLPIDFQIQQRTEANKQYGDERRIAVGPLAPALSRNPITPAQP